MEQLILASPDVLWRVLPRGRLPLHRVRRNDFLLAGGAKGLPWEAFSATTAGLVPRTPFHSREAGAGAAATSMPKTEAFAADSLCAKNEGWRGACAVDTDWLEQPGVAVPLYLQEILLRVLTCCFSELLQPSGL
eukprot:3744176-Amphidinium_carterae.2